MNRYDIGLDVGSTTVKLIVIDDKNDIVYKEYKRHFSNVRESVYDLFAKVSNLLKDKTISVTITGSGGFNISNILNVDFIQEVIACTKSIKEYIPETDVAIELGGEDAKITYFGSVVEQRMNGTCAGGTGAFIDQMASLLDTTSEGLNDMAKGVKKIYPIASRCGVFAKTDVQPLINEGISKEDISASVLQAVVNQTIAGLSQGKKIIGKVAFLGGPLSFLTELRKLFIDTLKLKKDDVIFPEDSKYYVAIGAALNSKNNNGYTYEEFSRKLKGILKDDKGEIKKLPALFENKNEYDEFVKRHEKESVEICDIENYSGGAFLGIDAGSTTTKLVLIGEDNQLLFSYYTSNKGNPLETCKEGLKLLKEKINANTNILYTGVTGYGEDLFKEAYRLDYGEIETMAHYRGAKEFCSDVDFILDIGGQDMKSLKIRDGVIESIILNEACSSGCGSFIETFGKSLGYSSQEFSEIGLQSKEPVDLGSRCTVFMNSKVKQAQKEGSSVGDISAGLAISVIKNALYKVIRIKKDEKLGNNIVVQGGTFLNENVLRAMELITGSNVIRPNISGIMGAYGIAILTKEEYLSTKKSSTFLGIEGVEKIDIDKKYVRCGKCPNNCMLTVNIFDGNRKFITGNRCEKGLGKTEADSEVFNMFKYKYDTLFSYETLPIEEAPRGIIGIPRVLNMYEDYPFWNGFFNSLGYSLVLSDDSSKEIFHLGLSSIPSESVCYPAKLVHGHIENLIEKGVKKIFYPAIPFNIKEDQEANNRYNCPVVTSYSETIKNNVESLKGNNIKYYNPFIDLSNHSKLAKRLFEELKDEGLSMGEIKKAITDGASRQEDFVYNIRKKGKEIVDYLDASNHKAIVLSGRPYHIDPEINHGIDQLIASQGMVVLTEDAVSQFGQLERPIRVVDQWSYHTRLYNAAEFVSRSKNLELIQLNSFGCGLDAVTTDQVKEILESKSKIYTVIKIDEISNLGAVKIRLRSLIAALNGRDDSVFPERESYTCHPVKFEKTMKDYTIIAPELSPIHFQFLERVFNNNGYNLVIPEMDYDNDVDEGLKYVNHDACYPSLITVGQIMNALNSGKYDLNKTAVIISQTGGGCRATNYIGFLRKALKDSSLDHIPVISLNPSGIEKNPGFKISYKLLKQGLRSLVYGDLLMRVVLKTRPYEMYEGQIEELYNRMRNLCFESLDKGFKDYKEVINHIVYEFDKVELLDIKKPKVGVVGEILVKFHPLANGNVVDNIEKEGGEAVVPDFYDFLLYCSYTGITREKLLSGKKMKSTMSKISISYLESLRKPMVEALEKSNRFHGPKPINYLAQKAEKLLSLGNFTGEGWFLTGEIVELVEEGVNNVLCLQPFGCLPNHITGKGMIRSLREKYPLSNIHPVDYDPGASEVNQLNRIKLMMSVAMDNL